VPAEQRLEVLKEVPAFARLPAPALEELAEQLKEGRYPSGATVVTEGEPGDLLYLIAEGRAEVSTAGQGGPMPLAALGPGEVFGEVALLETDGRRQATVTAVEPLLVLSLEATDFRRALEAHPELRIALSEAAEEMLTAKFLKQASPFTTLDARRLRWLASRLKRLSVSAGETIVYQGETGEECYLLRSGRVEVVVEEDGGEVRSLATLEAPSLLGEAAILTDAPRNATVRALEPCDLLVLRRADLLEAIGEDRQVGDRMLELLRLRDRPRQKAGVEAHHRTTPTGETITTLKDPQRVAYYRLSPQGYFLWQRLDGSSTLRDLTLEYMVAFKAFAPQAISDTIGGLAEAGFVEGAKPAGAVLERVVRATGWQRATEAARKVMEWQGSVPLTRLYRGGVFLLYTRPAQVFLAAISLVGIVAFVLGIGELGTTLEESEAGGWLLLFWIPATLIALLVHEAGHAFTTKHFGRQVPRVGVGWYWFGPVAYVDTSDMWLEGRWPRIAVSLAGPYTNLVLGSLASIVAWFVPNAVLSAVLWEFALLSYLGVLLNLNPLLEFDGYYVLIDVLDKPNLRPRALAWLGQDLIPSLRTSGGLEGHRVELFYGLASVLYVAFSAMLTVVIYRLVVQGWIEGILPGVLAVGLAWVLAAAVVVLAALSVLAVSPYPQPQAIASLFRLSPQQLSPVTCGASSCPNLKEIPAWFCYASVLQVTPPIIEEANMGSGLRPERHT
jgi:putative peptide zinc metalloprotease protein